MFNYMGATEDMVEMGVQEFGLAVGARKMIDNQYKHATQSLESGLYITYCNEQKKSECFRLGSNSKCFCGHFIPEHHTGYFGKKFNTACKNCPCKKYMFVPSRPEEVGMYWLVRRKDFNVKTWRPPCKCKHTNEQHKCGYPFKCSKCSCYGFNSNFACLTCDGLWEHHQVLYEMEEDRKMMKKPIRENYIPLSTHKNIQKEVFKKEKYALISDKQHLSKDDKKMEEKHQILNPKRPLKSNTLQSPLGIVLKPKYPEFMSKKK